MIDFTALERRRYPNGALALLCALAIALLHMGSALAQETPRTRTEKPRFVLKKDSVRYIFPAIKAVKERHSESPDFSRYSMGVQKAGDVKPRKIPKIPRIYWNNGNVFNINVDEVAFVNWNAGGNSNVSIGADLRLYRFLTYKYLSWNNEIRIGYGINAQEGRRLRKAQDFIRFSSSLGYRRDTLTNWFYSVKLNLNTQINRGFRYPDRSQAISRFMAPGYVLFGAGTSYILNKNKFNLYISPVTMKSTLVLDQNLADQGAFGVRQAELDDQGNVLRPGSNLLLELGFLVTHDWETMVAKNIFMDHRLSLYTDYLNGFGEIDVDWEISFRMTVNKFIKTMVGTHLIWDEDILFDRQEAPDGTVLYPGAPRLQFKQVFSLGMTLNF